MWHFDAEGRPSRAVDPFAGTVTFRHTDGLLTAVEHEGGRALARPSLVTYVWCHRCGHHKGWTGPLPPSVRRSAGPPRDHDRDELARDRDTLFGRLDRLWDAGELPQSFSGLP